MTTNASHDADDEILTAADLAAIDRALAEPGITLTADELADFIEGLDDEVRELVAAGRVAEAIGTARFNVLELAYRWNDGRFYRPGRMPTLEWDEV